MELLPIDLNIVADDNYIYLNNLNKTDGNFTERFKGRIVCAIRSDAVIIGGQTCGICPLNDSKKSNKYVIACKNPKQAIGHDIPIFRFFIDPNDHIHLEPEIMEHIYEYED